MKRTFADMSASPSTNWTPVRRIRCGELELSSFLEATLNGAEPLVVEGALNHWPAMSVLKISALSSTFGAVPFTAHVGSRLEDDDAEQLETERGMVETDVASFASWLLGAPSSFSVAASQWSYASYQHLEALLEERHALLSAVDRALPWHSLSPRLASYRGRHSTFWAGSAGAHTPRHRDVYGCNIILQIDGVKRWRLHAPRELVHVATRLPFEESSVWCRSSSLVPPGLECLLSPGDLLLLPRHWWHSVHCLSAAVSVNLWIPDAQDAHERLKEAIALTLVSLVAKAHADDDSLEEHEKDDDRNKSISKLDQGGSQRGVEEGGSEAMSELVNAGQPLVGWREGIELVTDCIVSLKGGERKKDGDEESNRLRSSATKALLEAVLADDSLERVAQRLLSNLS